MKIGLVSYTYHRFLGVPYSEVQTDPGVRWTILDVIQKTMEFGLDAVVLDSSLMPSLDRPLLREMARLLDDNALDRVLAWGAPNGLNGGKNPADAEALLAHLDVMAILGARVMRILGGSRSTVDEPHDPAIERLANMIGERCVVPAERAGVTLAIENNSDFTSHELLQLIHKVNSPFFKVCFDSGNAFRIGEDPVEAAQRLAPYVVCAHLKDIGRPIVPPQDWRGSFPCVPFGHGLINMAAVCRALAAAASSSSVYAIEMDRPREDFLDEDRYVLECAGYLRAVRQSL